MMSKIGGALQFFRENNWRAILARLNTRDTHPAIQFLKYAICGIGSLFITTVIWWAVCTWIFPAFDPKLPNQTRALHSTYGNCIAFCFGNLFAYTTNSLWVFTPGRHNRLVEFFYFTLVSTTGFAIGLLFGPWLIREYGIGTVTGQGTMIIASTLVNFICRKFFVFKG